MPSTREVAEWQVEQIKNLLKEIPSSRPLVIADYTAEEFAELKKGDDYQEYLAVRRIVIDRLGELGIADKVILHKVDSVKYYRFLAAQGIEHDSKSLAYFANVDYWSKKAKM